MRKYKAKKPVKFWHEPPATGTITDLGFALEFYWRDPKDVRLEDDLQKAVASKWPYVYPDVIAFHVPNETEGSVQDREKKLAMGIWPGMSDWVVLHPTPLHPFALIELKRATKTLASPVSQRQKETLQLARERGAFTAVAYGVESLFQAANYYFTSSMCT